MAREGYIGPDLAEAFHYGPAERACRDIADHVGDTLHELIVNGTPVRTGNLRSSWYRDRTDREQHGTHPAYVSRVKTDVDYAPYVEYPTGLFGPKHTKYLIEPHPPRKYLSWIDPASGERVFRTHVWHPGSEGAHMVHKAVQDVEVALDLLARPDLEAFKAEMEAQGVKAQARVNIG